jgi:hypothetical protein
VKKPQKLLKPGLYKIIWKTGGRSFAAINSINNTNYFASVNGTKPIKIEWDNIKELEEVSKSSHNAFDEALKGLL